MDQNIYSLSRLLIPFAVGGLIGWVYFSGLWETVRRLPETKSPHWFMILSYLARTVFALGGFYILADGQWERMIAALVGFFIIRAILVRRFGRIPDVSKTGACSWKS